MLKYAYMVGIGGIGSGMFFRLRGNQTLGRNESRAATLLGRRDFCKLHIIAHYVARLLGAGRGRFDVFPVGKVGDDDAGRKLIELMRQAGMDTRWVRAEPRRATLLSVCFLYEDGDGGNITNDDSACARLAPADVDAALDALADRAGPAILLAAPEVDLACRLRLLERARPGDLRVAALTTAEVGPAIEQRLPGRVDLMSLNLEEAAAVAGGTGILPVRPTGVSPVADATPPPPGEGGPKGRERGSPTSPHPPLRGDLSQRERSETPQTAGETSVPRPAAATLVAQAGTVLSGFNPDIRLCVTAGAAGLYAWHRGRADHVPACPAEVVSTAGAGDAVLAALIAGEAFGLPFCVFDRPARQHLSDLPLQSSADLAALLAGLAVSCPDTINFDADAARLRALAESIGADASRLAPLWHKEPP